MVVRRSPHDVSVVVDVMSVTWLAVRLQRPRRRRHEPAIDRMRHSDTFERGGRRVAAEVKRGRRVDLQVLRALAVIGVVGNHLFPNRLPGGYLGVDIFFVISGFLITSHLVSEAERTDRVRLLRFWARRALRLLPASLLVLGASTVATVAWLPQSRWEQVLDEIFASALYFQNWQLAASSQDYFRSSQAPSPVTHYWSLSVEEQFYLIWPLLVLLVWWLCRHRTGQRRRLTLTLTMVLVVASSLTFAYVSLHVDPTGAYFATPGRAWEFGIGAILGSLGARLPRLPHAAALPGWAAMVVSIWVFDSTSAVPGPVTLVPVLGCALVIWAGATSGGLPTPAALRIPVWLGDISYSIYLWHWPLIVFAPYVLGRDLTPGTGIVLLVLTLLVAHLSTRLVEDPFRRARVMTPTHRPLVAGAVAMTLVATIAIQLPRTVSDDLQEIQAELGALLNLGGDCVGAPAATYRCGDSHQLSVAKAGLVTITNSPYSPRWGGTCQVEPEDAAPAPCEFGVPKAAADVRLALVGDSHAGQWAAPLDLIAQRHSWNVVMQVKSSCQPMEGVLARWSNDAAATSCRQWGKQVSASLAEDPDLDVIVVSGISREYVSVDGGSVAAQWRRAWSRWIEAGKRVVVIGDVPAFQIGDMPTCLATSTETDDPCSVSADSVNTRDPLLVAAQGMRGVTMFDPSRNVCDAKRCHAVVGGLPVFGDANHLNAYFSRTFAPLLENVVMASLASRL